MPEPEALSKIVADLDVLNRAMREAGVWGLFRRLVPTEHRNRGTRIRRRLPDDQWPVRGGKEHMGGFTIIAAPDLDMALIWGRRLSQATTLPIEVRPFQDSPH